jgi:hypothetical protein
MPATSTERSKKLRQKRKEQGLVRKEVWIRPEYSEGLKDVEGYFQVEGYRTFFYSSELCGMSIEKKREII